MTNDIKIEKIGATTIRDEEISKMPILYDHMSLFNPDSNYDYYFQLLPIILYIHCISVSYEVDKENRRH